MRREFFKTTGKRIRVLRQDLGLKQSELQRQLAARGVVISASMVSQLENDYREPSADVLRALAQVLATTTDYLLLLSDDPLGGGGDEEVKMAEGTVTYQVGNPVDWMRVQDVIDLFQRVARTYVPATSSSASMSVRSP